MPSAPAAAPATPRCPRRPTTRCCSNSPRRSSGSARASRFDVTDEPRAFPARDRRSPDAPRRARPDLRGRPAGWPRCSSRRSASPSRRRSSPRAKINVIGRAELLVDCRVPPRHGRGGDDGPHPGTAGGHRRSRGRVHRAGRRQPLADRVAADGRDPRLGRGGRRRRGRPCRSCPAFTDSRHWRASFPDCIAYGFFPQRHQTLYDAWPLIHSDDERIIGVRVYSSEEVVLIRPFPFFPVAARGSHVTT